MENVTKRFLSLLVAVVMVLSMVPTTAFATTENTDETTTENTVVEETVETGTEPATEVATLAELKVPLTGNNGNAHIGAHTIWGQANVNASESMKLELYCGGTLVGTTVLEQKTPILNGSAKEVSWNFYLTEEAEAGDGYWNTTWETGHPNVNEMPDKVVLYLDGEKVDEDSVLLSGPDSINKVYAAISTDGVITGFATTLQAAIDAADGKTVTLLRDVTLTDTLNVAAGTTVTLDLNGKTISQTKAQTGGYSMIQNDGNLTILSSVEGGKLSYTDSGNGGEYVSNTITNRGTLTLKSGTVENLSSSTVASNGYPYAIDTSIWGAAAEVNTIIEGGKVYCESYSSMRLRADSETESVNITITGGEVYGRIEVQNPTSNKASKGTLTISDGKVYKNNSSMAIMFFANNSSGENMKASITGGMIDGAVGYSSYFGPVANFDENVVSGGTFTTDVSQFCVEGFELSDEDGDGIYEIAKKLSGTGTEADPFLITDLDDLLLFRDMVNTYTSDGSNQFKGKFVKLTADVDLAGVNWTPIGINSVGDHMAFLGTFDGDGHTIYNLYVNADGGHLGFFARVGSYAENVTPTVKNLKFHNVNVSANVTDHWTANHGDYVGGVIANAGGNSVVSNITVTGDVYIVGCGYVGGIVGHGYPDIDNCHVNANDGSYLKCSYWCGGGIIGYAGEGGTPITNCSVSGLDIWTAYGAGGGIAGLLQDGNKVENVTVSNLDITSDSDYCMGYVAGNGECSTMTDITVENVTATAKGNTITATDAVASVDGIVYFDLQAAVNAAEGKTVTLLRDVTLTDTLNVAAGTTVTLDLNGKTVSQTKACTASYEMVSNNGTLTIDDSVGGGKISFTDTGAGDPNAGWGVYTVRNAGTLVVNAGTIENLSAQNQAGQAFAHTVLAIFQYSGSTTINGGVISTPNYRSVRLWSGDMTIKGGEFSGQVWVQCVNDTSKLTIEGGEFAPCWNDASSVFVNNNYNNKAYVAEFGVTGGTFATKIGANDATTLNGSLICGGTFTESAMSNTNSALIAEGFVFEQNADGSYGVEEAPVAMVGTDKYKTIDEAIAAWTAGKTLTLLADVTLSDVITLKSTEHHILDLGTYTMTAASGKNAFVIKACGTGSAERSALTINADATNPGGINAGKKCVVYYKYADGGISTEDRPIIKINGGVFTGSTSSFGSAGIYTIGTAARKCATVNIAGGTFNCSIVGSSKSKLIVSGGTFNYTVSSQGDSTCSRLISGGKFKTIGFMTADSNNTKFWIGTSMGNSNVGVHVDDDGYIVVGGPVVTEPGTTFEASANYGGASSYLQYSSAKNNGLYYTSVEEAFADNNKASGEVTVYVDELDMTGSTYKGTILVPKGETLTITYAEGTTPTWKAAAAADDEAVAYTETVVDGVVTRVYRTITPVAQIGETYYETIAEAMAAAGEGDTVTILAGEYNENLSVNKAITVVGQTDANGSNLVKFNGKLSVSADGATVKNLTVKNPSGNAATINAKGVTIEGCEVSGSNAFRACYTNGTVTFKDSKITADTWAIHFDGNAGGNIVVENCEVNGWIAFASTLDKVTLEDSKFEQGRWEGGVTYNKNLEIDGCTFNNGYKLDINGTGATVTVTGSVVTDGDIASLFNKDDAVSANNITIDGDPLCYVAKIGSRSYYKTLEEALADVTDWTTIKLVSDATLDYNAREAYGRNTTTDIIIDGQGFTLTLNQKDSDWSSIGMANPDGKLTLKNMTIEKTGYGDTSGAWNTHAINFTCNVEMDNVAVNNSMSVENGATLNKVTINEANGYYGLWIDGNGQTVEVKDSTMNATNGGRGIKIADQYVASPAAVELSLENVTFNTAKKAAVLVSSVAGASITDSATNPSNISNVAADNENLVWVDEDWAENYGEVTVTNASKAQENEEAFAATLIQNGVVAGYYKTVAEAIAAAAEGDTVTLLDDVALTEILVLDKAITLDGNDKTLTSTATRAINVNCDGEVTIKDLTVATTADTERAINVIQKPAKLTLENVTAEGFKYTVNVAGSGAGSNINIEGGKFSGYAAIYIGGSNVTLTANNAELIGVNDVPAHASNTFGVIAINYGLEGSSVTVNGGTLTAISTTGNRQFIVTTADSKGTVKVAGATLNTVNGDVFNGVPATMTASFPAAYADQLNAQGFVVSAPVDDMVTVEAKAEATFNGVNYASLAKALMDAYTAGGKVTLLTDCELTDMIASIPAGVTLDLNGNTLKVNNIWAFGEIVDGTAGGDGVLIANGNVILDENNAFLPLYDAAAGGYRFFDYETRGRGVRTTGSGATTMFTYGFAIDFTNPEAYKLLKDTANSDIQVVVDLKWTNMPTGKKITYTVSALTVASFAENAYEDVVVKGNPLTTYVIAVSVTGLYGLTEGTDVIATMNAISGTKAMTENCTLTGTIGG